MNVLHDVDYEAWEQVQSRLNSEVEKIFGQTGSSRINMTEQ